MATETDADTFLKELSEETGKIACGLFGEILIFLFAGLNLGREIFDLDLRALEDLQKKELSPEQKAWLDAKVEEARNGLRRLDSYNKDLSGVQDALQKALSLGGDDLAGLV